MLNKTNVLKTFFLMAGLVIFTFIVLCDIEGFTSEQKNTLAILSLMATWWIGSAIHISITALLPLILFPLLAISNITEVAKNYAHPIIFLFMGGFMIGEAMKTWGLHERIALTIIQQTGASFKKTILGFMITSAFLSMWISNTTATILIVPMALAVISQLHEYSKEDTKNIFATKLLLAIAYSASIGGIATLIGTPPNIILAGQLKKLLPHHPPIEFAQWIIFALPISITLFLFAFFYLTRGLKKHDKKNSLQLYDVIHKRLKELGPMKGEELIILLIVALTITAWLTRTDLNVGIFTITGWQTIIKLTTIDDSTVAMFFALLMCIIPVRTKPWRFLLEWREIKNISWSVIILFGGGFALADGLHKTGLTSIIGHSINKFSNMPLILLIFLACISASFLTEVTSNTATASVLIPIYAAAAQALDIEPITLLIPITLSTSMAFMLPVATPPNAIVFSSGKISVQEMARAGLIMNIFSASIITIYATFFIS